MNSQGQKDDGADLPGLKVGDSLLPQTTENGTRVAALKEAAAQTSVIFGDWLQAAALLLALAGVLLFQFTHSSKSVLLGAVLAGGGLFLGTQLKRLRGRASKF